MRIALKEKLLQAQQQIELYQAHISKAFNKKVKTRTFSKGDFVLAVRRPMLMTHKKKENSNLNGRDHSSVRLSIQLEPTAISLRRVICL